MGYKPLKNETKIFHSYPHLTLHFPQRKAFVQRLTRARNNSQSLDNVRTDGFSVNFLDEFNFSSLVMGSNMDYSWSFRIKTHTVIGTPEIIIFGGTKQIQ